MKEQQSYFPHIVIYSLCLISSLFNYGDFEILSFAVSLPLFDVIVIFYYAAYRRIISIWFILLVGMITDSMSGGLIGVTSLSYIAVVRFFQLMEIRKVSAEEFMYVIKIFLSFLLAILGVKYLILIAIDGLSIDVFYIFFQVTVTTFAYVLCHKIFDDFYKKYFYEK